MAGAGPETSVQSEPFSFHIPLVLGLCGRFDDGLGRTFTGLRIVWHERHRTGVYHASGGKFGYPDDACETPDLLQTIYTFKDFTVMWDHAIGIDDGAYGRNHGLGFVGENGTLVIDRGGWEVIPEKVNGQARMELFP